MNTIKLLQCINADSALFIT